MLRMCGDVRSVENVRTMCVGVRDEERFESSAVMSVTRYTRRTLIG